MPYRDLTGKTKYAPVESVSSNDAAAGAEFLFTVPAGERWLLLSVSVSCVQGATQTPWPVLIIDDGTNTLWSAHAGTAAQAINTTCQHSWGPGSPTGIQGATTVVQAQGPLPKDLELPAGYRIQSLTTGIGANTNYGKAWAAVVKL